MNFLSGRCMQGWLKRLLVRAGAVCLVWICTASSMASEYTVTAQYTPDPGNPGNTMFINTSVDSGVCAEVPRLCTADRLRSFMTSIDAVSDVGLIAREAYTNERYGAFFSLDGLFRFVTLTNEATGSTRTLRFAVAGYGGRYELSKSVDGGSGHNALWWGKTEPGGAWWQAPIPCFGGGTPGYTNLSFDFFWRTPHEKRSCVKLPVFDIPGPFKYTHFNLAYSLLTPNPLDMDAGVYSGRLVYSVGPGGDIDFGDRTVANDNNLTINFQLKVNASLKVDFPPGAYRAVLQPVQGWQGWMNSGKPVPSLSASHVFRIAGSGFFKAYLNCEHLIGQDCAISTDTQSDASQVPVDIAVSLPASIVQWPGNQPALKVPLKYGVENAALFKMGGLHGSQSAKMHYDVRAEHVAEMVENPGSTYRGLATIIFDVNL